MITQQQHWASSHFLSSLLHEYQHSLSVVTALTCAYRAHVVYLLQCAAPPCLCICCGLCK